MVVVTYAIDAIVANYAELTVWNNTISSTIIIIVVKSVATTL